MIIKEYKKFKEAVVSFDFDGVLHTSMIPGTLHPINFILPDTWKPNLKLHDILKKEQKTHKVIIVTARPHWNKLEIQDFLKKWNLKVDDIITTNNMPKKPYLMKNNVIKHYDDNPKMITELKDSGIEFIVVDGEKLKKIS